MTTTRTTAQEFANEIEHPIVFWAGVGCPGGQAIAILEGTEFPFALDEIEGEVKDGTFEADNLNDGSGAYGWKFSDWNRNTVYKVQVYSDKAEWERQKEEYDACA